MGLFYFKAMKQQICDLLNGKATPEQIAESFGLVYTGGQYMIRGRKQKEPPKPPSKEEFIKYFTDNGQRPERGEKAYGYYVEGDWHDANGKPVKNWKMKARIWFDENPVRLEPKTTTLSAPRKML